MRLLVGIVIGAVAMNYILKNRLAKDKYLSKDELRAKLNEDYNRLIGIVKDLGQRAELLGEDVSNELSLAENELKTVENKLNS